ncbi:MAG: Asd/ArgC dimerization domain-containing protein, partial [Nitrososphaerales archaeon]
TPSGDHATRNSFSLNASRHVFTRIASTRSSLSAAYLAYMFVIPGVFPKPIGFNLIPRIGKVLDGDHTEEEMKMVNETKKIMEADIKVSATCVRVPVYVSHSEVCYAELEKDFDVKEIEDVLRKAEGVEVQNNTKEDIYPTPLEVASTDKVFVGRIRKTEIGDLALWIVADNLRKGAALNAVQIAELLISSDQARKITYH